MAVTLSSGEARAMVLPERGGLLHSLQLVSPRGGTRETLWMPTDFQAGESGWPGGGVPVLFPFAGRVFHEGQPLRYELGGVVRNMPIHGFAYAMPWQITAQTRQSLKLALRPNAATEELYPFAFEVDLEFTLSSSALRLALTARHAASAPKTARMPVATGLHPYFRAPLATGATSEVRLTTFAKTKITVTNAGGAGRASPLGYRDAAQRGIALGEAETRNVILVDHETPRATLKDAGPDRLDFSWAADFKTIVLFRKEDEAFQCVEPWMGLPDAVGAGIAAGTRLLAPGESARGEFEIALG